MDTLSGSAKKLAEAYMYAPNPYTMALNALKNKYGQARQLVQSELNLIMSMPHIKFGEAEGFDYFALAVQSLVGMLKSLGGENGCELKCGSHVDKLEGHCAMVRAWHSADVAACLPCGFESRLVQNFHRNIMFLPSQT